MPFSLFMIYTIPLTISLVVANRLSLLVAVYGMVPFLKGALGTMLPMLGMAKQDNMRWIISLGEYSLL